MIMLHPTSLIYKLSLDKSLTKITNQILEYAIVNLAQHTTLTQSDKPSTNRCAIRHVLNLQSYSLNISKNKKIKKLGLS